MTTTTARNQRYTIFYPEGEGYLFVKRLGSGGFGTTSLICTPGDADHSQLAARKALVPNGGNLSNVKLLELAEVELYRECPLMLTVLGSEKFDTLMETSKLREQFHLHTIRFEYCNGGILRDFSGNLRPRQTCSTKFAGKSYSIL
jgi:hypothetical protein